MRLLLSLAAVLVLAACGGDDDRAAGVARAGEGRVDPASAAGVYEIWVCNTAECGPGTAMAGTRVGRLVLTAERSVAVDESAAAFVGCINLGGMQQFDRSAAMTAIAWAPTERPGELAFTGDHNSEGEYEIALNDLGGMLRGRGRWRRGGVFGEETPDFIVARRLDHEQMDCPTTAGISAFDAVARSPVTGDQATGGKAAGAKGGARTPAKPKP